jgi:phosphoribosylformylglycinamidine synthase
MTKIREEVKSGKPLLGICNGAQVIIETGLVPGIKNEIEMALAPNINPFIAGYYCTWVNIKVCNKSAFTLTLNKNSVIPIPVAHGEGRFTTKDTNLLTKLIENNQIIFRYCDKNGEIREEFPINPNGSLYNIAALSNKEGNIMAIMPHPERASWKRQLPFFEGKDLVDTDSLYLGSEIFKSMKLYIEERF